MMKMTPSLRFAVPGAMVLGLACAAFAGNASAQDATKGAGDQKPVTDVGAGNGGNSSSLRSNSVTDVSAGNGGNTSSLRSNNVTDVSGNGGNAANLRAQGVQN